MATFNWHRNIAHLLAVLRRWLVCIWVIRIEMVANARKRFGFNRCNRVVEVRVVVGVIFNRVVIAVVEIRVVDVLLWAPPTTAAATSLLGVRTCSRRKYVRCTRTCTYCIKLNQRCWKAAYKTDTCTSWHHLIHVHIHTYVHTLRTCLHVTRQIVLKCRKFLRSILQWWTKHSTLRQKWVVEFWLIYVKSMFKFQ